MPTRSEKKLWRSLRRRKGRDETGLFLAEGPNLLRELLRAGIEPEAVLFARGPERAPPGLLDAVQGAGIRCELVEGHVIGEIADASTPQPVLSICRMPDWGWDDVRTGMIVVLDGIQDPGNVGTLTRTALGLGAAAVVLLPPSADPWGPKAVRASAGAGFTRPVFRADAASTIAELEGRKLPLWVADAGGEPAPRGDAPGAVALALGSEAHGVSRLLRDAAARTVAIPMAGPAESLNVAAAGAILIDRLTGR